MKNILVFLPLVVIFCGCQPKSEAGSTDPHGTYSPEEAKAAAQAHFSQRPAPRSPGQNAKPGQ